MKGERSDARTPAAEGYATDHSRGEVCGSAGAGTSGTEPEQHTHPHTSTEVPRTNTSTVQQLDDALLAEGVFALSRKARLAVAEALWQVGVSADDVAALSKWVRSGEPELGVARRYLAGLLSDASGAVDAIADLRKHDQMRAREGERNRMDYRDAPQEGEPPEVWEHDRMCRIAFCRVVGDGRSVSEVAAEIGVQEGTVTAMLDRGRLLQGGHEQPKKVTHGDDPKAAKERRERFVEDMKARGRA